MPALKTLPALEVCTRHAQVERPCPERRGVNFSELTVSVRSELESHPAPAFTSYLILSKLLSFPKFHFVHL